MFTFILIVQLYLNVLMQVWAHCMKYFRERYTSASINISNPQIQLRHVQSLRYSQEYLFHRTSARKQLYPPGDMRYTGSEASKAQKCCSQCGALGHNYKRCPQNAIHGDADAGPSGNPTDGAPPTFRPPLPRIARGRHSVS